jgi:hypothetical protein
MNGIRRSIDAGALIFGLILVATGVYYALRNTLGLQLAEIEWDRIWPFIVLAIGTSAVLKAWTRPDDQAR